MAGMGVLHLEIWMTKLQQQGLEIVQSQPIINYRETVRVPAGPVMSRSPNRHNKIFMEVMPLSPDIVELIRNGTISETADKKSIQKTLREPGWDSDQARSVVAVDERGNMMTGTT